MGRDGHDRARAVAGQHIVGDPDRHRLAVDRVDGGRAREDAGLVLGEIGPLEVALAARLVLVGAHGGALRVGGQLLHQRVLGRQHHVGGAVQRVGPGGEDADLAPGDGGRALEDHLGALAAADPVALHGHRRGRPVDRVQVGQQAIGVAGDAQQPLAQVLANHRRAAALAAPLRDLFVGEAGLVDGAPVDGDHALVGQAAFVELQEDPLRPLHVGRIGGVDLARPVVGEPDRVDLPLEVGDGLLGGDARVDAVLDGVVLRRQAEGVPAHRVQHAEPLHPLPARDDVGRRVALAVADVKARARRVREHVQGVELGPGGIAGGLVQPRFPPAGLPLGLDGGVVVRHGRTTIYCPRQPNVSGRGERPAGEIRTPGDGTWAARAR